MADAIEDAMKLDGRERRPAALRIPGEQQAGGEASVDTTAQQMPRRPRGGGVGIFGDLASEHAPDSGRRGGFRRFGNLGGSKFTWFF